MAKFKLSQHEKNDDVLILGKYQFKNREMIVSDTDAQLIAQVLCRFYNCTLEVGEAKSAPVPTSTSTTENATVAKASTKS